MLQNPQIARTFFLWILQGFLHCDSFSAEFVWPWCIQKELMSVPQKMRLVPLSHLLLSFCDALNVPAEFASKCRRTFFSSNVFAQKFSAAIFSVKNQSPKRARASFELRSCGAEI
jgi:hypothetical protein